MDEGLKQRLIGAVLLLALAVIFLPVLFDRERMEPIDRRSQIPDRPEMASPQLTPESDDPDLPPVPDPRTMFLPDASARPAAGPGGGEQTDAVLDARGTPRAWVLQVARFADLAEAVDLTRKLIDQGYTAFYRSALDDTLPHGVFLGPKLSATALRETAAELTAAMQVQPVLLPFVAGSGRTMPPGTPRGADAGASTDSTDTSGSSGRAGDRASSEP